MIYNYARSLRGNPSKAEKLLWYYLRNKQLNNYKFRRQHVIKPYIVDFVCIEKKLIIELE
ncbi:MAG: endonuclease domain-containing protein [Elusimicrobiota bacterium]